MPGVKNGSENLLLQNHKLYSNYIMAKLLVFLIIAHPFSENAILVILPEWPAKLATLARSFKSQIFMSLQTQQTLSWRSQKNFHTCQSIQFQISNHQDEIEYK